MKKFRGWRWTAVAIMSTCAFAGLQGPAMAATGENGVPILSAATSPMVHTCNVVGGDGVWEAVVCSDLITTETSTAYYVQGQGEAYCEEQQAPHAIGTCERIIVDDTLYVGSGGSTATALNSCDNGGCPNDGRLEVQSAKWGYTIAGAANGTCSSNVNSSYQVWGILTQNTQWTFPDGHLWSLDGDGANDGANESSGHYFVCP